MSSLPSMATTPSQAGGAGGIDAVEFAELMRAFNEVTARLESTHGSLRREVAALKEELARLKADNPGLKRSQYQERCWAAWQKSPENPMNQQ